MKHTDIGGQALIEGVMMRSEKGTAVVVRRGDGSLAKEFHHQRTRYRKGSFPTWPFVRGVYAFVQALSDGMSITTRAAELLGEETEEPSKFELWLSKRLRRCLRSDCSCCCPSESSSSWNFCSAKWTLPGARLCRD